MLVMVDNEQIYSCIFHTSLRKKLSKNGSVWIMREKVIEMGLQIWFLLLCVSPGQLLFC